MQTMQINGEIQNIKQYIVKRLEALYELTVPIGQLSTHELNAEMLEVTELLGREVAVYLNRQGKVLQVSVGDTDTVDLPEFKSRRAEGKLTGIRCIHTHPSGDTRLSEPDFSSLRRLRFDCMAAIGFRADKAGEIVGSLGFFTGDCAEDGTEQLSSVGPLPERALHTINLTYLITTINKKLSARNTKSTEDEEERALLAGLDCGRALWPVDESMAELARLADTAGATIVGTFIQRREKPDAAFFLGRGKVAEIAMEVQNRDATLLILDDELTPSQQHNLEQMLGIKVIDRTALILDIFAQRARTKEGKLQVELAQLQYNLPRLGGQGLVLSRLGGGIGTRGPGETKLEVDRRRIYARIHDLESQIDAVQKNRSLHRRRRKLSRIPLVALVGYTNAGKSTLLNQMTGSDVYVQDQLFATLDAVSRRIETAEHTPFLLVDTVGFIRKLPHALVSAFRSTLEEAVLADVLVIVNDGASEEIMQQHDTVLQVLSDLGATEQPRIEVINKCDLYTDEAGAPMLIPGAVRLSAKTGEGIAELHARIAEQLQKTYAPVTFVLPFDRFGLVGQIRPLGRVVNEEYTDTGLELTVVLANADRDRLVSKYGKEILKG